MTRPLSALDVAVDAVAVARLTHLLQQDEVFPVLEAREAFKQWAGDTRYADLITCPWCLSTHLGLLAVVARRLFPRTWNVASRVLASSAVAGHLAHLEQR